MIDGVIYKQCKDCKEWFVEDTTNFGTSKKVKGGFNERCRQCQKKYNQHYYREHKGKIKEQSKQRYYENKEADNARSKKRYKNNPKYYLKNSQKYKANNKEEYSAYQIDWRKNNKNKTRQYSIDRGQKNHKISKDEWKSCKNYFNNSCAYCGLPIEEHYRIFAGKPQKIDLHKEHVNDKGANDLSNCVPSCGKCNSSKHNFTLEEWYNEDNNNYSKERLEKICQWLEYDYIKYIKIKL